MESTKLGDLADGLDDVITTADELSVEPATGVDAPTLESVKGALEQAREGVQKLEDDQEIALEQEQSDR